jgi:hypothetical protein
MKTAWTAGLDDPQVKDDVIQSFKSCAVTRKRLQDICRSKMDKSFSLSKEGYECPNWIYKQADTVGYQRAMHEIISLLS